MRTGEMLIKFGCKGSVYAKDTLGMEPIITIITSKDMLLPWIFIKRVKWAN